MTQHLNPGVWHAKVHDTLRSHAKEPGNVPIDAEWREDVTVELLKGGLQNAGVHGDSRETVGHSWNQRASETHPRVRGRTAVTAEPFHPQVTVGHLLL